MPRRMDRALEIAESLDDTDYRLRALWGLFVHSFSTGEYRAALVLAERFHRAAANAPDPDDAAIGDRLVGVPLHLLGDQAGARLHFERALARYDAPTSRAHQIRFQFNQHVATHCYLARVLWLQGFADQAIRVVRSGIAFAHVIEHPQSLVYALIHAACPIALFTGDLVAVDQFVSLLFQLADRHGMAIWNVWGQSYRGVLLSRRGDAETGAQLLRAVLGRQPATVFHINHSFLATELASALGNSGKIAEGLAAIDGELARCERSEEGWYLAELLRVRGEIVLMLEGDGAGATAEACFRRSFDCASSQGVLSLEMRAAVSLARLRIRQGRQDEARGILAPVYSRFTEGFETADMRSAKSLLGSL